MSPLVEKTTRTPGPPPRNPLDPDKHAGKDKEEQAAAEEKFKDAAEAYEVGLSI